MNELNFMFPDGFTTLEIRVVGTATYRICGLVPSSKATSTLSVQKIVETDGLSLISYAECLYADVETADYKGLED